MNHPLYPPRYGLNYKSENVYKYYMKCPTFTHKTVEDNMKIQDISPKRWADDEEVSREEMDNRQTYIGSDKGLISLTDGNIKYDQK